jgi:DNA-binding GntR family transcriptional regulator
MSVTLTAANLNERVYEELRTRVLTRREPAGTKLSLHALAGELGVSRSPVHHALTRLVSEGLLTVRPRRGYYVTPGTADALADGYDVRLALELLAAERAIGGVHENDLARFAELLDATEAAISHDEWDAANAAFHEHQIDLAGNALLSRFYRELSVNLMMQVLRGGHVEGHAHLVTEHRHIVEAFAAGELEAAEHAIREHIETGRRIALDAIQRSGGVL